MSAPPDSILAGVPSERVARWCHALLRLQSGRDVTNWHTEAALLRRGFARLVGPPPVRTVVTARGRDFLAAVRGP